MRKKITTLLTCVFLSLTMFSQKTDSFFTYQEFDRAIDKTPTLTETLNDCGFNSMNVNAAPIGDGVVTMITLATMYMLLRRKEVLK